MVSILRRFLYGLDPGVVIANTLVVPRIRKSEWLKIPEIFRFDYPRPLPTVIK